MRTTLDLDDDLLAAAKELARRDRTSAGRVVSDLMRKALSGEAVTQSPEVREPPARYGFRPFPVRGPVVTNEHINRLREELE